MSTLLKTVNIVATYHLGCIFNMKELHEKVLGSKLLEKSMGAVVWKVQQPKTTFLIYKSGKCVCLGASSLENCEIATSLLVAKLVALGYPASINYFQVQNIVFSVDLGYHIDLPKLYYSLDRKASFEPEIFPGLRHKIGHINFTVFRTGKINVSGATTIDGAESGMKLLKPVLDECQKKTTVSL